MNKIFVNDPALFIRIKEAFPQMLLIYYIFLFSISNYNRYTILIKIFSSFLIFFSLNELKAFLRRRNILTHLSVLILVLIYLSISSFLSVNSAFGFIKLLIMTLSCLSLLAAVFLVMEKKERLINCAYMLIILSAAGSIISVVLAPFDYSSVYLFSLSRWSHVVFSRIIGLAILADTLLILCYRSDSGKLLQFMALPVLWAGLISSGARGTIIVTLISFLALAVYVKSFDYNKLILVIQFFIAAVISLVYLDRSGRIPALVKMIIEGGVTDVSILSRMEGFAIAIERWASAPAAGIGLGGFNSFYGSDLPLKLIYPHNMLLEVLAELGLIGFILIIIFLYGIAVRLFFLRKEFLVLLIYGMGLALYSKDLASNPLLFGLGAVYFWRLGWRGSRKV